MRVLAVLTGLLSMTGIVASLPQNSADPPDLQSSKRPSKAPDEMKNWVTTLGIAAVATELAIHFARPESRNLDRRRRGKILPSPPSLPLLASF